MLNSIPSSSSGSPSVRVGVAPPIQQQPLHVSSSFPLAAEEESSSRHIPSSSHPAGSTHTPLVGSVASSAHNIPHPSTTSSSSQHHWHVVQNHGATGPLSMVGATDPSSHHHHNHMDVVSTRHASSFSTESSSLEPPGSPLQSASLNAGYGPSVVVGKVATNNNNNNNNKGGGGGRLLNGPQSFGGNHSLTAAPQQSISCSVGSRQVNAPQSASLSHCPLYPWSAQTNESISSQLMSTNTATFAPSDPHSMMYGSGHVGMSHGSFGNDMASKSIGGDSGGARLLFIPPPQHQQQAGMTSGQQQHQHYVVDVSRHHQQLQQQYQHHHQGATHNNSAPWGQQQQQQPTAHFNQQPMINFGASQSQPQYSTNPQQGGGQQQYATNSSSSAMPPHYFAVPTQGNQMGGNGHQPQSPNQMFYQQQQFPSNGAQQQQNKRNSVGGGKAGGSQRPPNGQSRGGEAKGPYVLPNGRKPSVVFSVILMELPEMLEVRTPPNDQQQEFDGSLYFSYKNVPQETLMKASSAEQFKRLSDTLQKYFDLQRTPTPLPEAGGASASSPAAASVSSYPERSQPGSPVVMMSGGNGSTPSFNPRNYPQEPVMVLAVHPFDRGHKNRGMARVVLNKLPLTWVGKVKIADATGAGMSPAMIATHAFGPASGERAHEMGVDCIPLLVLDPVTHQIHFALEEGNTGSYNLTEGPISGIPASSAGSKLLTHRFHVDRGSPAFPGRFVRAGENVKAVLNK